MKLLDAYHAGKTYPKCASEEEIKYHAEAVKNWWKKLSPEKRKALTGVPRWLKELP